MKKKLEEILSIRARVEKIAIKDAKPKRTFDIKTKLR